ncbi:MAG TPA: hypothetical protein VIT68_03925 [Candidatus Gracilibacteria bacterium]
MAPFRLRIHDQDSPSGECASCQDHELLFGCADGRARCESCAREVSGDVEGALRVFRIGEQNTQARLRADDGPKHRTGKAA